MNLQVSLEHKIRLLKNLRDFQFRERICIDLKSALSKLINITHEF